MAQRSPCLVAGQLTAQGHRINAGVEPGRQVTRAKTTGSDAERQRPQGTCQPAPVGRAQADRWKQLDHRAAQGDRLPDLAWREHTGDKREAQVSSPPQHRRFQHRRHSKPQARLGNVLKGSGSADRCRPNLQTGKIHDELAALRRPVRVAGAPGDLDMAHPQISQALQAGLQIQGAISTKHHQQGLVAQRSDQCLRRTRQRARRWRSAAPADLRHRRSPFRPADRPGDQERPGCRSARRSPGGGPRRPTG